MNIQEIESKYIKKGWHKVPVAERYADSLCGDDLEPAVVQMMHLKVWTEKQNNKQVVRFKEVPDEVVLYVKAPGYSGRHVYAVKIQREIKKSKKNKE